MSYSQAIEEQIRLHRTYVSAEKRRGLLTELVRSYDHPETGPEVERELIKLIMAPLSVGEAFYWSPPMCDLLERSAETLPEWVCDTNLPITKSGFCWLARPIPMTSGHIRAFGWVVSVGEEGLGLVCYGTVEGASGPLAPRAFFFIQNGHVVSADQPSFSKFALCGAALLLIDQRILTATQQPAERHTRKRLASEGYKPEPLIRVVELRRKQVQSTPTGEHETVDWSHQWIVSGHWRQQWYPSLNANQPRWIMPYVKGPEDKPLKPPRAKVFAVVR